MKAESYSVFAPNLFYILSYQSLKQNKNTYIVKSDNIYVYNCYISYK